MCKRQKKGFNKTKKKKKNWFVTKEKRSVILQKDRNVLGDVGVGMWVHRVTLQQMWGDMSRCMLSTHLIPSAVLQQASV